jgi:ABC-type multidrug transport system fused ATPase/permease subunit
LLALRANGAMLGQGRVLERGIHQQLLEEQGTYAALWCEQKTRSVGAPV